MGVPVGGTWCQLGAVLSVCPKSSPSWLSWQRGPFFPLPMSQCSLPAIAHVSPPSPGWGEHCSHRGGKLRHGLGHDSVPPTQGLAPTMSSVPGATWGGEGRSQGPGNPDFSSGSVRIPTLLASMGLLVPGDMGTWGGGRRQPGPAPFPGHTSNAAPSPCQGWGGAGLSRVPNQLWGFPLCVLMLP